MIHPKNERAPGGPGLAGCNVRRGDDGVRPSYVAPLTADRIGVRWQPCTHR